PYRQGARRAALRGRDRARAGRARRAAGPQAGPGARHERRVLGGDRARLRRGAREHVHLDVHLRPHRRLGRAHPRAEAHGPPGPAERPVRGPGQALGARRARRGQGARPALTPPPGPDPAGRRRGPSDTATNSPWGRSYRPLAGRPGAYAPRARPRRAAFGGRARAVPSSPRRPDGRARPARRPRASPSAAPLGPLAAPARGAPRRAPPGGASAPRGVRGPPPPRPALPEPTGGAGAACTPPRPVALGRSPDLPGRARRSGARGGSGTTEW